jgi:hypothetical protein
MLLAAERLAVRESLEPNFSVIPAKAGIHFDLALFVTYPRSNMDSRFRGNDDIFLQTFRC